jgi:hypothetical protein
MGGDIFQAPRALARSTRPEGTRPHTVCLINALTDHLMGDSGPRAVVPYMNLYERICPSLIRRHLGVWEAMARDHVDDLGRREHLLMIGPGAITCATWLLAARQAVRKRERQCSGIEISELNDDGARQRRLTEFRSFRDKPRFGPHPAVKVVSFKERKPLASN